MRVSENFRHLRQRIWTSAIYRRGRRIVTMVARPFALFELAIIYRKDLTAPLEAYRIDADLDMGEATAEEVERAANSLGRLNPRRDALFRWRLRDGCVCFVARSGSAIVAYVWMRYRPGIDDGALIELKLGEVYSFDMFVDENWRGRRIFTGLGSRSRLFFKERGYTTVYSRVSMFNRSSRRGMRRGGWTASGLVLRATGDNRGGWPIVTLSGSAHPLKRRRREARRVDAAAPGRRA